MTPLTELVEGLNEILDIRQEVTLEVSHEFRLAEADWNGDLYCPVICQNLISNSL